MKPKEILVFGASGQLGRNLLRKLTPTDLSNDFFPFGTAKEIEIGYGNVIALRMTYVGELGWEIFVPNEFAQDIYDKINEFAHNCEALFPFSSHLLFECGDWVRCARCHNSTHWKSKNLRDWIMLDCLDIGRSHYRP